MSELSAPGTNTTFGASGGIPAPETVEVVPVNASLEPAVKAQTLAANGAVTLDASLGGIQAVTLAANATSSAIVNPQIAGQLLTVEWIQDGTGSRTYVWPTNCKFAAGTAPAASTAAGDTDSVTFRWDGTNWKETARAIGVH